MVIFALATDLAALPVPRTADSLACNTDLWGRHRAPKTDESSRNRWAASGFNGLGKLLPEPFTVRYKTDSRVIVIDGWCSIRLGIGGRDLRDLCIGRYVVNDI